MGIYGAVLKLYLHCITIYKENTWTLRDFQNLNTYARRHLKWKTEFVPEYIQISSDMVYFKLYILPHLMLCIWTMYDENESRQVPDASESQTSKRPLSNVRRRVQSGGVPAWEYLCKTLPYSTTQLKSFATLGHRSKNGSHSFIWGKPLNGSVHFSSFQHGTKDSISKPASLDK